MGRKADARRAGRWEASLERDRAYSRKITGELQKQDREFKQMARIMNEVSDMLPSNSPLAVLSHVTKSLGGGTPYGH